LISQLAFSIELGNFNVATIVGLPSAIGWLL